MQITVENFSLHKTLTCGQFFRYWQEKDTYFIAHTDKLFKVKQQKNKLIFSGVNKEYINNFFRLDDPYKKIINSISKDSYIKKAISENKGLRIIRQDPWECLISYICSSMANIPKIQKNLNLIAKNYGDKIEFEDFSTHTFPEPGQIKDLQTIRACKVGYRAGYIEHTNRKVDRKLLRKISKMHYTDAKKELMKIHGVGEKVADCVCLFSMDKLEAFPVDVWIKRAMKKYYSKENIRSFAKDYFGEYAGYANQFLFQHIRNG